MSKQQKSRLLGSFDESGASGFWFNFLKLFHLFRGDEITPANLLAQLTPLAVAADHAGLKVQAFGGLLRGEEVSH